EQAEAWQRLVKTLEEKMILYHPSSNSDLVLRTDASTIGVGGMVAMIQDGVEKPLAFFSKKFTEVQQKWCTLEQEAFGLFWVMSKAKNFLWGRRFIAETDHRNLSFMLKSESAKVQRWRMAVMEFDFVIHHIKGKDNTVADTLSRCYVKSLSTKSLVEIAKTAQEALTDEEKSHLKEKDGFWVDKLERVVIPKTETTAQEAIVEVYHNALFSGHYDSCLICQKTTPKPDPSIMGTLVQKAPFDQLSVDLFGPIDPDAQLGYKYLTVFVDNFSRFVELVPSESTTVLEAKQALLQVIGRHG
ncbi:hypothetical protein ADUPG1_002182, partial [Aduncisulcus paluster]